MKLEFLPEGSADCPLIRLYAFDRAAVLQFNDLVISLATGASTHASLHKQAWIEPVRDCELKLLLGKHDRGVSQTGPLTFECHLSKDGWNDVVGLLKPFCKSDYSEARSETYQWLNETGKISLLISHSGKW